MKTFEDMKHSIPEGATHYSNETDNLLFAWLRPSGETLVPDVDDLWELGPDREWIEIPEELEEPKQVEWKNGDECVYKDEDDEWNERSGRYVAFDSYINCHVIHADDGNLYHADDGQIKKPESPEEREQRQRLEAAYDLYCLYCKVVDWPIAPFDKFKEDSPDANAMLAIVDKTSYRKGGEQ